MSFVLISSLYLLIPSRYYHSISQTYSYSTEKLKLCLLSFLSWTNSALIYNVFQTNNVAFISIFKIFRKTSAFLLNTFV